MATDADTGTAHGSPPGVLNSLQESAGRFVTQNDYRSWKILAWCGPIFMATFVVFWGILAGNMPPFPPSATPLEVKAHYVDHRLAIMIGMSICLTVTSCYMAWGCAISQVMRRIEGPGGLLAKLEMMGATITAAPIMTACGIWLTAAHEAPILPPEILHMMYWGGWLLIDLAYFVTSFQIAAVSLVFSRDKREKPFMPSWVNWWGWVTFASFFVVSAIPFVSTGPLAFDGIISFWIAFFTWFIWCPAVSFYVLKAIGRIQAEDKAAAANPTIAAG